jgi:tetratricopeptide (TPR) repeat protein
VGRDGKPLATWFRGRRRWITAGLALVLLGSGAAGTFLWAQYHLRAAEQAIKRHDLNEAQRHLDLALKVHSKNSAIRLLAAQTARRRAAYEQAEEHLAVCLAQEGMPSVTALERLLLTAQQGDLEGMEGLLKARTSAHDAEAELVLEALAIGYLNRFWQADALACLDLLLERRSEHPEALLLRARVLEGLAEHGEPERDQEALRDYEKAIALSPSFEARLGWAGTLYRVGRPWEAMLEFERLRTLQPDNPFVLFGLARCRFSLNEMDEARRLLDLCIERLPDDDPQGSRQRGLKEAALLERGRLAIHAGQWAQAEKWLRRAADLAPPSDVEPSRLLSQCLQAERKDEEFRRCQNALREREARTLNVNRQVLEANRDKRNVALRYEIAQNLLSLGLERDGVSALFHVLEQEPRHAQAHAALSDYFERMGQPRRSARHRRAGLTGGAPNSSTTPARP